MDFSRMAAMVSLAYAHVHCYPTVDNPWVLQRFKTFSQKATDAIPPNGQPLAMVAFGCGHRARVIMWVWILRNKS